MEATILLLGDDCGSMGLPLPQRGLWLETHEDRVGPCFHAQFQVHFWLSGDVRLLLVPGEKQDSLDFMAWCVAVLQSAPCRGRARRKEDPPSSPALTQNHIRHHGGDQD